MERLSILRTERINGKTVNIYGTPEKPLVCVNDFCYWCAIPPATILRYMSLIDENDITRIAPDVLSGAYVNSMGVLDILGQSKKPEADLMCGAVRKLMEDVSKAEHDATVSEKETVDAPAGLQIISGIECYTDDNGVAWLKLEAVARGLGFTQIAQSGRECVRWERVNGYLKEIGYVAKTPTEAVIPTSGDGFPVSEMERIFIPENVFYRLAMKAKNETAERFQSLVADEVIPAIRKHGMYATPQTVEAMLADPDTMIRTLTALKEERAARIAAENAKQIMEQRNEVLEPKAEIYDALSNCDTLFCIRDTAKNLGMQETAFIEYCLEHKYLYREPRKAYETKGRLRPTSTSVQRGLFVFRERYVERSDATYGQALVTFKGREHFLKTFGVAVND